VTVLKSDVGSMMDEASDQILQVVLVLLVRDRVAKKMILHHLRVPCGPIIPHQQPRKKMCHISKSFPMLKKKTSLEPKRYFGHSRRKETQENMKCFGFFP
jgi:hypothetical protein